MREVPASMTAAWLAEDKTGPRRPTVRATVQKVRLLRHYYDVANHIGGDWDHQPHREGSFTSVVMGHDNPVIELRNIKSISWSRSVDQDVAECTLTLLNSERVPIGGVDDSTTLDRFDMPGAFTYSRGEPGHEPSPWGYADNDRAWNGLLVPDRLVRTYEGYGVDWDLVPGRDPNLMISGTWLIDEVTYQENGEISVRMRDIGRLLMDQVVFPPCVPHEEYPLSFSKIRSINVEGRDARGGTWRKLNTTNVRSASSSNDYYVGGDWTNAPAPHYVRDDGSVTGHHARHVLAPSDNEYWLSTGQDDFGDFVWWECRLQDASTAMNAIRLKTKGGPYRVFISIHNGTEWAGKKLIPYEPSNRTSRPSSVDIEAQIPYVATTLTDRNIEFDTIFKRRYGDVDRIRITFRRLHDTRVGEHPFNAGLRSVSIYTAPNKNDLSFGKGMFLKSVGNYQDYTDIVKWICAWGGFHWATPRQGDFIRLGPNDVVDIPFYAPDPIIPSGNIWGDFMNTGTAGKRGADLKSDLFDKQPLLDVITYVRDIVGYSFWIDETGGVVWRMPNIWSIGNYLSPTALGVRQRSARTDEVIELNADEHLLDYQTTLNSKNLRERIFVANTTGKTGVATRGYQPYPVAFQRVAGWTDQHFETHDDAVVMADMIAARQLFDYRRSRVRIAGYPAIQIDDQIRIFAPVTNETYYHYVKTVSCNLDMGTGEWTYDLETHWLGENPEDVWVVDVQQLRGPTKIYLSTMGVIDSSHGDASNGGLYDMPDWTAPAITPAAQRPLGMYHPDGGEIAVAKRFHYDRLPDISSSYYRHDTSAADVRKIERRRIDLGVHSLINVTTKGTTLLERLADQAPAAMDWLDGWLSVLQGLANRRPDVIVRATLEAQWEKAVANKTLRGPAAQPGVYARAQEVFYNRCATHAPDLVPGLWVDGADTDRVAPMLAALDVAPQFIAINAFARTKEIETFNETVANDLARWRTGVYSGDYTRLGSPPIGLGETGISTEYHFAGVTTNWYYDLRPKLASNDLDFAIVFNGVRDGRSYKIDTGPLFGAVRYFSDSLRDR